MPEKQTIHTIAHTHWDYEWYFTRNESQVQLDYHLDELLRALDSGLLKTYLLDGQSSLLEDHLVNCPDNREAIVRHVRAKRLLVGPWYTQSDLMIVAGESIVKNLQLGIEYALSLGHCFDIAYVPDSFGLSQDMPKIFSGVNLQRLVFWRGLSSKKSPYREFLWRSENGSTLTCYNIREGYFPGSAIIWGDDQQIKATADACTSASHFGFGVFPVGGDQRYVDFDLQAKINKAGQESTEYKFIESDYQAVFANIDQGQLSVIEGEMLDAENSKIHRSIYSTRYDHKHLNDTIERKLIYTLEPLMAMGTRLGLRSKRGSVDNLWKQLLKNHAHDSAGGCNSDKTNFQILTRYINANEQVDAHIDYLIRKIAEATPEPNTLTLFNTQVYPANKLVRATINTQKPSFMLMDNYRSIAFEVENVRKVYCGTIQRNSENNDPNLYYYETDIIFRHEMAPLSFYNLQVAEQAGELTLSSQPCGATIEDSHYQLSLADEALTLTHKITGVLLPQVVTLINQADDGDNYDYSPLGGDTPIVFDFRNTEVAAESNGLTQTLHITGQLQIPAEINNEQRSDQLLFMPFRLSFVLEDDGLLKCRLVVDNSCKDHRLRVRIDTGIDSEHSQADTPYGTISRPVRQAEMDTWKTLGWHEEPTGIYPMLNMVSLHNKQRSLSVFTKGIKEYEITGTHGNCIELTAFRSVGWLGKPALQRRPGKASGNEYRAIPTPDSQLLKTLECEFALSMAAGFHAGKLRKQQQHWACDILHYQKQELNRFTGPLKYFVSNPMARAQASEFQFFKKAEFSSDVVCSIFKQADDGRGYVLRLVNMSGHSSQVNVQIEFNKQPLSLVETDLTEKTIIQSLDRVISFDVMKTGEIKTFLFDLGD